MNAKDALAKMRKIKDAVKDIRVIVNAAESESDLIPTLERARRVKLPN